MTPAAGGGGVTPVTSRTPPDGSMSVASRSTSWVVCSRMKAVCGTAIGVVFAPGGALTSMRAVPVAMMTPSVTVYSMLWVPTWSDWKRNVPPW